MRRLLELAWTDVEVSRSKKDGKHLLGNSAATTCPSHREIESLYPFLCPCVKSNPAYTHDEVLETAYHENL